MGEYELFLMEHRKFTTSWKYIVGICLISLVIFSSISVSSDQRHPQITPTTNSQVDSLSKSTPLRNVMPSSSNNLLEPHIFSNNSQIAAFVTEGDGLSWDSAYIIEDYTIEQNSSLFGLAFLNTSAYVIVRNVNFYNRYPGVGSASLLVDRVENLRIEDCNFRAYSRIPNSGIFMNMSTNIFMEELSFYDYEYGLKIEASSNCQVNNSDFFDQRYAQIKLKDCYDIKIHNSSFRFLHYQEYSSSVQAIDAWNVSNFEVKTNSFDIKNQYLFIWQSENITIDNNELPNIAFYEVKNLYFANNVISKGLEINSVRNSTISENTFQDGDFAIEGNNCYNFIIEQNRFQAIAGEIFHFRYYSVAPYTQDPYWLEIPTNTIELITGNIIIVRGPGLWRNLPSTIQVSANYVIPQFGYFILAVVTLFCFVSIFRGYFIYRKKEKSILHLINQFENQTQLSSMKSNLDLLNRIERMKYTQTIITILLLCGIYGGFLYSELYSVGNYTARILYIFTKTNYEADLSLMSVLIHTIALFIGLLLCYFTLTSFQKRNRNPKILPPVSYKLSRKEMLLLFGLAILVLTTLLLSIYCIYIGNYPAIALNTGIIAIGAFSLNLILKVTHRAQILWIELIFLGITLILGYIFILRSIDLSLVSRNPPQEVFATYPLLFWSLGITGAIAALRNLFTNEEKDFTQGGKILDVSE